MGGRSPRFVLGVRMTKAVAGMMPSPTGCASRCTVSWFGGIAVKCAITWHLMKQQRQQGLQGFDIGMFGCEPACPPVAMPVMGLGMVTGTPSAGVATSKNASAKQS